MQTYKLLQQDGVLLSQPILIEKFGRAGAQFLSQLHYWLNHNQNLGINHKGTRWIYNSAESWAQQLHLSVRQVRRVISKFINCEILKVEKLNPHKSVRTNYYSIDYKKLNAAVNSRQSSETTTFTHSDILSPSSRHNGTIYNDTKITNKELNKSDEKSSEIITNKAISKNSIKQVKELKNINEKNREECKESVSRKIDITGTSKFKNDIDSKQTSKTEVKQDSPKNNTAQAMLKAWNNTFSFGEKMSKELAPLLVASYNSKFSKDLNQWENYLSQIKSSNYLRSEKFNLSIFWALKFSVVDRIKAGEFGVKKELIIQKNDRVEKTLDEVKLQINQIKRESVKALELRHKILGAIGVNEYLAWFDKAKFLESNAGKIHLEAHNAFAESVWKQKYDWVIGV